MRPLDRIDARLLELLQNNARLSNKELAARVGLAPSTTLERVRRLHEEGVFRGFHAALEPRALGIGFEALISIRLAHHSREQVESFRSHALSLPEVVAVYHLTGKADYLIHVAVRNLDHLRELALASFTTRPEVDHMETSVLYQYTRKPGLPIYAGDEEAPE